MSALVTRRPAEVNHCGEKQDLVSVKQQFTKLLLSVLSTRNFLELGPNALSPTDRGRHARARPLLADL